MTDRPPLEELRNFAESLRREVPATRIEFMEFPSGAVMIDAVVDGRLFVFERRSNGECGAGEVLEDEAFLPGHPFASDDWPASAAYWRSVVLAAASRAPQPATV